MSSHWHWLIVLYLFLGGLGAGAYLTSFAAEKGWLGKDSSLKRVGYYVAAPIVAFGTVLLVFDLGQGLYKPWLIIGLLFNFNSVMTWGVYILSAFIIIGFIKGYLTFKNKLVPKGITLAGALLALATGAYTGLLISVIEAIPFWNTGIMPVLFVVSALSTGLSLSSFLVPLLEKESVNEGLEGEAHLMLIGAELILIAIFIGIMISGANGPAGLASVKAIISGTYALAFWVCLIGLGLFYPALVLVLPRLSFLKASKGVLTEDNRTADETAATVQKSWCSSSTYTYLIIVADISILIGGFTLRALIILAALPIWDGYTIP